MPYEIPKWAVDGATVLAFVFAALPYLVSPEATNKALPRFIKRFRGWIAAAALVVFMWLLHKQPFMHNTVPVWGVVDGAAGMVVLFFVILRMTTRVVRAARYKQETGAQLTKPQIPEQTPEPKQLLTVPNYVDMAGMRWPISLGKVRPEPVCGKCNRKVTATSGYNPMTWNCKGCNTRYDWNHSRDGDPQDAAAEIVNSNFRANDQPAPVSGYHYRL